MKDCARFDTFMGSRGAINVIVAVRALLRSLPEMRLRKSPRYVVRAYITGWEGGVARGHRDRAFAGGLYI